MPEIEEINGCRCQACTTLRERQAALRTHNAELRAREEVAAAEQVECGECGDEHPPRDMLGMGESLYCTDCTGRCTSCRRVRLTDDLTEVQAPFSGTWNLCSNCTRSCEGCDEVFARDSLNYVDGYYVCIPCANYCDDCDAYYRGDECSNCENRVRGLKSYGKTRPNLWLGGPVPKDSKGIDTGYYLGIELEVSASSGRVNPIYLWARENLGNPDALECKEDSSVDGFEIATQPMTPEFFEKVNWESFFDVINEQFPLDRRDRMEPVDHGLHVHIGRAAFGRDDIATAAFCYLIGQGDHLVRIGRRAPTTYCRKVDKPVSTALKAAYNATGRHPVQANKRGVRDAYPDRSAINLMNQETIEIRAFRSTRKADELRDAVRLVYVAAEYIRSLRRAGGMVSPRALHWGEFAKWVGHHYPDAFASIAGITDKKVVKG